MGLGGMGGTLYTVVRGYFSEKRPLNYVKAVLLHACLTDGRTGNTESFQLPSVWDFKSPPPISLCDGGEPGE